ncbi:MAG: VOC family protein, partial [Solirubrobacterales bacterium]|nr:VOC family protein [Solirubrobacterales bacterium]
MAHGTPTLATGKICYLEIPAADVESSSRFYRDAFGWELRTRGDGAISFDDAVNEVSGTWVTGRPPSTEPGIMVHIMVADLEQALAAVRAAGGAVLNKDAAPGERVGHVRDPAGNVIGVYQQPGLAERELTVRPVPEHLHTVTPRLACSDGAAGIEFYKAAFDAQELGERYHMPDGTLVHAELLIGDSVVMVKDAQEDDFRALLATYWPDVDAVWARAVNAGAEIVYPLADQFYG